MLPLKDLYNLPINSIYFYCLNPLQLFENQDWFYVKSWFPPYFIKKRIICLFLAIFLEPFKMCHILLFLTKCSKMDNNIFAEDVFAFVSNLWKTLEIDQFRPGHRSHQYTALSPIPCGIVHIAVILYWLENVHHKCKYK